MNFEKYKLFFFMPEVFRSLGWHRLSFGYFSELLEVSELPCEVLPTEAWKNYVRSGGAVLKRVRNSCKDRSKLGQIPPKKKVPKNKLQYWPSLRI